MTETFVIEWRGNKYQAAFDINGIDVVPEQKVVGIMYGDSTIAAIPLGAPVMISTNALDKESVRLTFYEPINRITAAMLDDDYLLFV